MSLNFDPFTEVPKFLYGASRVLPRYQYDFNDRAGFGVYFTNCKFVIICGAPSVYLMVIMMNSAVLVLTF